MNRRRVIKKDNYLQKISSLYDLKANNIAFIIPVSSRKRNYKNIQDIDFFRILYNSFLKTCDSKNYNYSFYLGYDDDDIYYQTNKKEIEKYFKNISNDNLYLIEISGLQGCLGEIWSRLADIASKDNDFLYQIGDDIMMLDSGWENVFISKLKEFNYIGVVGPKDLNSINCILTQSFVHITHLNIFGSYYPKKIKNWYIDDWITNVYPEHQITDIKVINSGGCPRYEIVNDKKGFLETLKESKKDFQNMMVSIKNKKIQYKKEDRIKTEILEDKIIISNNRIINSID